jgi:hypothetical protein
MVLIPASIASAFLGGCMLAGAAMLQYEPARQPVEVQITSILGSLSNVRVIEWRGHLAEFAIDHLSLQAIG